MQILYSYLRYTDRLLIGFSCCSLSYHQSFMRNQEGKIGLKKKVHIEICVRDITFLAACPPSYVICCYFFCLLPPFCLFRFYAEKVFFAPANGGVGAPSSLLSTALYEDIKLELEYYSGFIFKFLAPLNLNIFIG